MSNATTSGPDTPAVTLRTLLTERNALAIRLNESECTDDMGVTLCSDIDRLEAAIISSPAATPDDTVVKLVTLAQIAAGDREIVDHEAIGVVADAQRHLGLGYLPPADAASVVPTVPVGRSDQAILDAFGARRREFEATYDTDMTREEEDGYFNRLDACEAVIHGTPATTIEGIIAKLRIAFMHQDGSAWADRAIMDPSHPNFVAGLAASGMYTRMSWSAIEDLARLGGVDLAEQGRGGTSTRPALPSAFEAKRLEYLDLDQRVNTTITDADNDPRFHAMQARMKQIEGEMAEQPARSVADARTKLRFMVDTDRIGVPLDGQEAHVLIKDAARLLLDGEAGA